MKITLTQEDGSTVDFVEASSVTPAPVVAPEDVEVDIVLSDGTTKTFVPKEEQTQS
jgi:hypothetical protein